MESQTHLLSLPCSYQSLAGPTPVESGRSRRRRRRDDLKHMQFVCEMNNSSIYLKFGDSSGELLYQLAMVNFHWYL